ncbi:MAG: nucleoside deaminase [bacterium]|nr:nucleoside deaminase [bacterium]
MPEKYDVKFMKCALEEATKAFKKGEVPIGCVIVKDGEIVARGHNTIEKDKSSLSHAEVKAIKKAQKVTGDWRLNGCTLYSTVEPCVMCVSACILSRVDRVVYGCREVNLGGCGSIAEIHRLKGFSHKTKVEGGILEEECSQLMKSFFKSVRKK